MRIGTIGLAAGLGVLLTTACQRELVLPGERYDVRDPLSASLPADEANGAVEPLKIVDGTPPENRALPISLPGPQAPGSWTQRSLTPDHRIPHLALSGNLTPAWKVKIGAGNDRRHRITADPVVAEGRIYTLDAVDRVMAHTTGGGMLWSHDLTAPADRSGDASGGGIAYGGGRVYVTSGYGTVTALDAASGAEIWQQKIGAVGNAAPTLVGDMLYVMGRDTHAWAIRATDGKVAWMVTASPSESAYVGGAGVAISGPLAVLPFASGELVGVLRLSGVRTWGTALPGRRQGRAIAGVTDFTGDPVVAGNVIYAANSSGRMSALDAGTGKPIWTVTEGSQGTPVLAGGSLFLVSDASELLRLDADTGARIWGTPLPDYVPVRKARKLKTAYAHYGPLLAGGRILVASSDGVIRLFDPVSGAAVGQAALPGGATSNPVIVGGVMYVVTAKGELIAFR